VRGPPSRHPDEPREQLPAVEGFIADASDLVPGVRVVYPNQGVCAVIGIEEKDIAGQKLQLVRMTREEDGAAVLVPKNKVPTIGLRKVATGDQIEGVFHYLAAQFDDPELDWKVRHRDNADRLIAGGLLGVAEVVKGLHSLSRIRPLPTKEREQYDNARHLLVHEVAVALGVPAGLAEDYVDYALMPPAGVKFDLKPPPPPVLLPSRPKKRRPVAEETEGVLGDLGIAELGLDLELERALETGPAGTAVPLAGADEAAEPAEEESEAEGAEEEEEKGVPAPRPDRAKPPKAAAKKAPPEKSRKAAARKPPLPLKAQAKDHGERGKKEKPAVKKAVKVKPAPKRGGKKR